MGLLQGNALVSGQAAVKPPKFQKARLSEVGTDKIPWPRKSAANSLLALRLLWFCFFFLHTQKLFRGSGAAPVATVAEVHDPQVKALRECHTPDDDG
jgi:hypothetical protein